MRAELRSAAVPCSIVMGPHAVTPRRILADRERWVALPDRGEVKRIIEAIAHDGRYTSDDLLPLVYAKLRQLAAQNLRHLPPGQTLGATALVHEAYLRLVADDKAVSRPWDNQGHFYVAAAQAMRRVLIDRAREKGRMKRGGDRRRADLDLDALLADDAPPGDLLDLDAALDRLDAVDPDAASLVKLRLFAGLNLGEAAAALGVSRRTADRDWAFARAFLLDILGEPEPPAP